MKPKKTVNIAIIAGFTIFSVLTAAYSETKDKTTPKLLGQDKIIKEKVKSSVKKTGEKDKLSKEEKVDTRKKHEYLKIERKQKKSKQDKEKLKKYEQEFFNKTIEKIKNTSVPKKYKNLPIGKKALALTFDSIFSTISDSYVKGSKNPKKVLVGGAYNSLDYNYDLEPLIPSILSELGLDPEVEMTLFSGKKIKHYPQFIEYYSYDASKNDIDTEELKDVPKPENIKTGKKIRKIEVILAYTWHFYVLTAKNLDVKNTDGKGKVIQLKGKKPADLRITYVEGDEPKDDVYAIKVYKFGYLDDIENLITETTVNTLEEVADFMKSF